MAPTRPVDVNFQAPTNINPHRITADEREKVAGVDKDKLDRVAAQMASVNEMGPAIASYFRLVGEKLNLTCTRDFEKDIKALPAQPDDPGQYKMEWFDKRDTSRGVIGQDYLPDHLISDPEKLYRSGLLTKKQAQSLHFLANTHSDPNFVGQRRENLLVQDPNAGQGQRGYQEGGGQGQNQQDGSDDQESNGGNRQAITGAGNRQAMSGPPAPAKTNNTDASNQSGNQNPPNYVQGDEDLMNSMFPPGDPYADFMRGLFPQENQSRTIFLDVMKRVQHRRDLKQKILAELNKLDPSKPQDAAKLWKLQNEMQTINMDDQMDLDALGQVRAEANKMKDFERSIIEALMQDRKTLAQNIAVK